ncbi:MAG: glucose-6-phosphate dehydrogenase [Mangrovibacterium sp.]
MIASQVLIIFGASGDLTKRKLIPALYELYKQGLLPKPFAVLGVSRTTMTDEQFRQYVVEFLPDADVNFLNLLFYQQLQTDDKYDYPILHDKLNILTKEYKIAENYIFYLSTPPRLYRIIPEALAFVDLNGQIDGFRRVIVEKPFGVNLASAKELNTQLLSYFEEKQIYRIDHYLGKETVQNMLVTRFGNGIFEPIWNHNFIERIEITSSESLGVEKRGGYYDHSGAMRDMVQNHLLQLVGMVAMEPPVVINADAIRNEVLKVFQSFRPFTKEAVINHVVRGQYTRSSIKGEEVRAYREEHGVVADSRTETFFAMKFFIDNWRWGGVPFYIRTGKQMPTRVTEVVIHFKQTPHHLFGEQLDKMSYSNQLIIRIQPDEGILLKMGMKIPGAGFRMQRADMSFRYDELTEQHLPTAYERLLLDCMQGDATLYARGDTVIKAWEFVQPILDEWAANSDIPIYGYPAGTWGPNVSDRLIENGKWRYPCKNLVDDGKYCEL